MKFLGAKNIKPLKNLLFIVLFVFSSAIAFGQQSMYNVYGVVTNTDMARRESGVNVSVTSGGSTVENAATSSSGKFNIRLAYGKKYKIEFTKSGLASRFLYVDLTGINAEDVPPGDILQEFSMSLFGEVPGADLSFLKTEPTTTFTLNMKKMMSEFDKKQADDMKTKIDAVLAKKEAEKSANEDKMRQYEQLMTTGDQNYAATKYEDALKNYQDALALLPTEAMPKQKIDATKAKIAERDAEKNAAENEAKFNAAIQAADKAFVAKDWATAESKYEEALNIHENDQHATQRIIEIDEIMSNLKKAEIANKEQDEKYKNLITAADNLRDQKQYDNAKAKYNEAIAIKAEQYPKDQITAIDVLVKQQADEAKAQAAYDAAMKAADLLNSQNKLPEAKAKYTEASGLKPSEQLPKDKIAEIDKKIADAAAKDLIDKSYNDAIKSADDLFGQAKYTEAKAQYQKALGIKPDESYPKTQMTAIDAKLKELEAQKNADKAYNDKIAAADTKMTAGALEDAKKAYQEASVLKPTEAYPKDKIAAIDKQLADQKQEAENNAKYDKLITDANTLYASNDLENAKAKYTAALAVKPAETLPKDKIAEIDKKIADGQAAKELEKKYNDAITQGATFLTGADYDKAKAQYQIAQTLKPDEQLPKDKLAEIAAKVAEKEKQAILDKQYTDLVAAADVLFNTGKYADAKAKYQEAKQVKQDPYLDERIKTIDDKLAEIAASEAKQKAYNDKIVLADNALGRKELDNAQKLYEEALVVDPSQAYPKEKIKEIATQLASLQSEAEKETKFNALVKQGDDLSANTKLEQAVAKYEEALAVKPDQGVQQKIDALNSQINLAKGQAQKDADYQAAIDLAQGKENANNLEDALAAYKKAQSIKPAEVLPAQKITEIQNKITENQRNQSVNESFNKAIKAGDDLFAAGQYQEAKNKYQEAGTIKDDPIVPQKIALAEQKMKDESNAQVEENYQKIINKANELKSQKDWENAIKYYERALTIKPDDSVPKDAIAEIRKQQEEELQNQANQADAEKQYNDAMALGNQKLASSNLEDALNAFFDAKNLKPNDAAAQQKIDQVNKLIQDKTLAEKDNYKYDQFIKDGDKSAVALDYEKAIESYKQALGIKANDSKATQKIADAQAQIDKRNALGQNQKYAEWIGQANQAFVAEQYDVALNSYTEALKVKPGDKLATDKISEINQLLDNLKAQKAQGAANEAAYKAAIDKADSKFVNENWKDAQKFYETALDVKPKDNYASSQLQLTIDKQKEESQAMVQKEYQKIINKGDQYFGDEKWDDAKRMFERALTLKSDDPYPQDKLTEIARILANGGKMPDVKLENLGHQENITVMDGEALIAKAEITRKQKKNERNLNRSKTSDKFIEEANIKTRNRELAINESIDSTMKQKAIVDADLEGLQNDIAEKVKEAQVNQEDKNTSDTKILTNTTRQNASTVVEINKQIELSGQQNAEIPKDIEGHITNTMVDIDQQLRSDHSDEYNDLVSTKSHLNNIEIEKDAANSKSSAIRDGIQKEVEDIDSKAQNKSASDLEKEYSEVKAANAKITEIEKQTNQTDVDHDKIISDVNQKVNKLDNDLATNSSQQVSNAYNTNLEMNKKVVETNTSVEEVAAQTDKMRQDIVKDVIAVENSQEDLSTAQSQKETASVRENKKIINNIETAENSQDQSNQEQHQQVVEKVENLDKELGKTASEQTATNKTKLLTTNQSITNTEIANDKDAGSKSSIAKDNAKDVTDITNKASDATTEVSEEQIAKKYELAKTLDKLDAKGIQFNETIANSLANEYPAGVTEENFTINDDDGLMVCMKTRRIVVKNGRGDVYVRSTSRAGNTYTKNGTGISEATWQKETQDATLEKH